LRGFPGLAKKKTDEKRRGERERGQCARGIGEGGHEARR